MKLDDLKIKVSVGSILVYNIFFCPNGIFSTIYLILYLASLANIYSIKYYNLVLENKSFLVYVHLCMFLCRQGRPMDRYCVFSFT